MKIMVSARLKPSQIKYKIIPLTHSPAVSKVYILRKEPGPAIDKVEYIILPSIVKFKIINILLTPFLLSYYTINRKVDLLVTYNFLPHGFFGYLASRISGVPYNYSQIDTNTMDYVASGSLKGKWIRAMIKKAAFINVPGRKSKEFWTKQGILPEKIFLLHSTIDVENEYLPNENADKKWDFIYVGVLEKRKQVDKILEALIDLKRKGKSYSLIVVGGGEEMESLKALSKEGGISEQVHFQGHCNEVRRFIDESKIFVLTSKLEGIPCALMESMACGLVPVVSDVADIADVVNETNGYFLAADFEIPLLAETLATAIEEYHRGGPKSIASRNTIIQEHSYVSATKEWTKILHSLFPQKSNKQGNSLN